MKKILSAACSVALIFALTTALFPSAATAQYGYTPKYGNPVVKTLPNVSYSYSKAEVKKYAQRYKTAKKLSDWAGEVAKGRSGYFFDWLSNGFEKNGEVFVKAASKGKGLKFTESNRKVLTYAPYYSAKVTYSYTK